MELKMARRLIGLILLLHLLVLQGHWTCIEAALCEFPSNEFRGVCVSSHNCAQVCEREGYTTGRCQGFRFRCICAEDCDSPPGPPVGPSPDDQPDPPDTPSPPDDQPSPPPDTPIPSTPPGNASITSR